MTTKAQIADLPRIEQTRNGVAIKTGAWQLKKTGAHHAITAKLQLAGYLSSHNGPSDTWWELRIERRVKRNSRSALEPAWECTVRWTHGAPEEPTMVAMAGHDRTWADAIACVRAVADLPFLMGATAERRGFGVDGKNWIPVRPFKYEFPWKDPREPNCKYSPITWCGPSFDADSDGVVAYAYAANAYQLAESCQRYGANARLDGPDADGKWWVYHRDSMRTQDEIDIDDWRGRLIAGVRDSLED